MLYVFHVDTGTMLTFDMNLAMHTVANLHAVIAESCHIPEDKQVLLISGGQSLEPSARVCSYSAGTDSNPIYLFSKTTIEAATPPSPSVHYGSDVDIQEQVEGSLIMPPSYETVVSRTQLSLQFHDIDREELKACEHLVHDQHIQQQGWAAVVANLEDITSALIERSERFKTSYNEYLATRPEYITLLESMNDTLHLLSKIPIVKTLIADSDPDSNDLDLCTDAPNAPTQIHTLYDWISAQDSQHSLENMVELCVKATEQFNESVLTSIDLDMDQTLESVSNQTMKEVKGLEDRLYGLDQIMNSAKRLVQEQSDISQGFVKNQNRATNLRDNSILPDLCSSHKKQLLVLLRNHEKLRDIKKKCRLAKEELSVNLHTRLRWVMFVEKKICDVDGKIMIHHENVKRLRKRLDILRQINDSPELYAKLVVEVVCRKHFSTHFLKWAQSMSAESCSMYDEETSRRKKIIGELGKHFLQILFPSLHEIPAKYATEAPEPFDESLPHVTLSDIQSIRDAAPELTPHLQSQVLDTVRLSSASLTKTTDNAQVHQSVPFVHYTSPVDKDICGNNTSENCCSATELTSGHSGQDVRSSFMCRRSSTETFSAEMKSQGAECEMVDGQLVSIMHLKDPLLAESPTDVLKDFTEVSVTDVVNAAAATSPPTDAVVVYPKISLHAGYGDLSQEFTTADFYIDESMPSSISYVPSAKTQKPVDLRKLLEEKSERVIQLEAELAALREKRVRSQRLLQQVVDVTAECLKQFRSDCSEWQLFYNEATSDLQRNFFDSFALINDRVIECDRKCREGHMNELQQLMQEHDENRIMYEEKLCVAETELSSARDEVRQSQRDLEDCRAAAATKESMLEAQMRDARETYENERQDLIRHHRLELEIEMDKVREEMMGMVHQRDGVVGRLETRVRELEGDMVRMSRENEEQMKNMEEKCRRECGNVADITRRECREEMDRELSLNTERLEAYHAKDISDMSAQYASQLDKEQKRIEAEIRTNLENEFRQKNDEFCRTKCENLEKEKQQIIDKVELDLKQAHEIEMSLSQERFMLEKQNLLQKIEEKSCFDSAEIISQTELLADHVITKEEHDGLMAGLRANCEALTTVAVEEALSQREVQHKQEVEELRGHLELSMSGLGDSMRMSLTAEKQVMFNAAITKVTMERERDQEDFKKRESELLAMQQRTNDELLTLQVEYDKVVAENNRLLTEQHLQHEQQAELPPAHESPDRQFSQEMQYESSDDGREDGKKGDRNDDQGESSGHFPDSSSATAAMGEGKLHELQSMLRVKEDEIGKLQNKLMTMSMSAQAVCQDKVSITSCNIGDVVLLCLDEKHDQYVVFTVGTTLHFLHSDCLDVLSLRPSASEVRKSWVLAEVTEKEYCQARKPNNRFKVPTGTKFYRVKAKPWSKEQS